MSEKEKPTHTMPGGRQIENRESDNGVVNDSFGKIDPADTTGTGEDKEPAKPRDGSERDAHPHSEGDPHRR